MGRRRSVGVTALGVLFLLPSAAFIVHLVCVFFNLGCDSSEVIQCFITALLCAFLSMGILKLKNWVRILCLWIFWIFGISIFLFGLVFGSIFEGGMSAGMIMGMLLVTAVIVGPAIFFLTRPEVKEQFK